MNSDRDGIRGGWATPGDDQSDAESAVETTGEFTIDYAPPAWYTQNASGSSEGASPASVEEEESDEAEVSDGSEGSDGAGPANGADGAAAAGGPRRPQRLRFRRLPCLPSRLERLSLRPPLFRRLLLLFPPLLLLLLTVVRVPFRGCPWGVGSSLRHRLLSRPPRVLPVCPICRTSRLRR